MRDVPLDSRVILVWDMPGLVEVSRGRPINARSRARRLTCHTRARSTPTADSPAPLALVAPTSVTAKEPLDSLQNQPGEVSVEKECCLPALLAGGAGRSSPACVCACALPRAFSRCPCLLSQRSSARLPTSRVSLALCFRVARGLPHL